MEAYLTEGGCKQCKGVDEDEGLRIFLNATMGVRGCPEFCVNGFSINSTKSVLQTGWRSGSAQLSSPGLASSTSC